MNVCEKSSTPFLRYGMFFPVPEECSSFLVPRHLFLDSGTLPVTFLNHKIRLDLPDPNGSLRSKWISQIRMDLDPNGSLRDASLPLRELLPPEVEGAP